MVIRVNVVVELLVFGVLFVTQLTVEIGSQVFQSLCNSFLLFHLVLLRGNKEVILIEEAVLLAFTLRCIYKMYKMNTYNDSNITLRGAHLVFLPQFFCVLLFHLKHSPLFCGILCIVHLQGKTQWLKHNLHMIFFFSLKLMEQICYFSAFYLHLHPSHPHDIIFEDDGHRVGAS